VDRQASLRRNGLVYALWAFGVLGHIFLFRHAWVGTLNERDFAALWVAGKLAATGHVAQVFDVEALRAAGRQISHTTIVKLAYPYPPHALFIAVPLSFLPLWAAFLVWQTVSGALFYFAARPYCPRGFPKILALLTPAALISVLFGQVGLFFGALWLFAFAGSPIAAAALTFKPHLGALVGIDVIRRRKVLLTIALAGMMMLASVLAFGVEAWRAWFIGAATHQLGDLTQRPFGIWRFQMTTPYLAYGVVGWLLFSGAAIALLSRRFDVFTAATGSFLIAPYGLHYDMTVVCLGFGLLLYQRWRDMPAWETFICAIAFLLPLVVALGTWIASPILLAGLYVQIRNPIGKQKGGAATSERPEVAAAV
jgi:hypothetical protein